MTPKYKVGEKVVWNGTGETCEVLQVSSYPPISYTIENASTYGGPSWTVLEDALSPATGTQYMITGTWTLPAGAAFKGACVSPLGAGTQQTTSCDCGAHKVKWMDGQHSTWCKAYKPFETGE